MGSALPGLGEEQDEEQDEEQEREKDAVPECGALSLLLNSAVGNGGAVR